MKQKAKCLKAAIVFLAVLLCSTGPAMAQQNPDLAFFKGKILRLVVPANPGEQFDRWARILGPGLQKQLPGCTVIVENVGGGGRKPGTNRVYRARPDGLTVGLFYRASLISQLVGEEGVDFDFSKFVWLGNISEEPRYLVVAKNSPYLSVADITKAKEFKFGATGVGSYDWYDITLLKHIFKWDNVKVVAGYRGSPDILAAILRGEVNGYMAIGDIAETLDPADYRLILEEASAGRQAPSKVGKIQQLADVAPKEAQPFLELIYNLYYLAKPVGAPPGLPEGRARVLSTALENVTKEPQFLELAQKNGFTVVFTAGDKMEKMFKSYLSNPPKGVVELLQAASRAK